MGGSARRSSNPGRRRREREARERQAQAWLATPAARRKAGSNALIATLLALFLLDTIPTGLEAQVRLVAWLDPLYDASGLWQGPWNLFAPEPDQVNSFVSASFVFRDGRRVQWRSPDWRALGVLERARRFRQMEYWDDVRADANRPAWDALASYLARTEGRRLGGGDLPQRVELTRHWARIPPPPPGLGWLERIEPPPLQWEEELFHVWESGP